MGKVEDFINSLEGRTDLEITSVVGDLLKLHNEEIGTASAKISQMESTIGERDAKIAEKDQELSIVKAANWDLVNQITPAPENGGPSEDGKPGPGQITFDDIIQ